MNRAPRRLVSLRRLVSSPDLGRYEALWSSLQAAAVALGAHAWRFAARDEPSRYLEFLEFAEDADPRSRPDIGDLLARLNREIGAAELEEWVESPPAA